MKESPRSQLRPLFNIQELITKSSVHPTSSKIVCDVCFVTIPKVDVDVDHTTLFTDNTNETVGDIGLAHSCLTRKDTIDHDRDTDSDTRSAH